MDIYELTVAPRPIVAIRETVTEPGKLFDSALPRLFGLVATQGLNVDGPALGIYYRVEEGQFDMAVALPVDGADPVSEGPIRAGELPAGRAAATDYTGPYDGLGEAWAMFRHEIDVAGHTVRAEGWEEYHVGPDSGVDSSEYRTTLVQTIE